MYLSNDEYTALNSDYSGMQDERDINVREADVPLSRPNYMDTKNNPEIASAFEKQRQNWLKTNPWGGDVDDLNDLVNFGNKVNKVGNTKAAATLTKQSMDYFKNNPGRGLGEADTWSKPMSHPDYMDYKTNPEIASAFEKQRQNYLNTIPSKERYGAIRKLNDIVDTGNVFAAAKTGLPDDYLPHAKVRQVITKQSMDYFKNNLGRGLGEAKAKPGHNARVMANNLSKVFKAKPDFLDMDKDGDKEEPMKKAVADSKKKVDESALDEAGAFSYGKKPRKGTVAYNAAEQRKKQEKNEKPIEPKDQKVGNAKVTKDKVDESESYVGRETKDGTWRVFKTGNAVAVAGPFKSAQEAQAWIKKQSMNEAPLLGPQGKIHRAASADQSDREYASQKSFKDAWTAKNVGKKWPGYAKAGFKSPYDFKEESAVNEAVTLDYSRYMRAHGKKPRDAGMGSSTWMFTTSEFGDPSEDEIFQFQGSFADAKKAAAKWTKSQGEYRFYVME